MDSWASSCGSFGVQCLKSRSWMVIFVFSSPFLFANYEGNLKFKISDELYCRLQSLADPNETRMSLNRNLPVSANSREFCTEAFKFREMAKERFQSIHRCVNGNLNAIKREIKKRPCQNSQTKWTHSSRDANGYAGVHFLDVFYKFKLF